MLLSFISLLIVAATSAWTLHATSLSDEITNSNLASRASQALSFKWTSSAQLIYPKSDGQNVYSLKDPSIIYYDSAYHVFASISTPSGYNLVYLTFTDFSQAENATFHYLSTTPLGTGYRAAPQVFHMSTQNLWYLIYQDGNAAYSTNTDITNPAGWSAPSHFFPSQPSIVTQNIGSGYWVDMWVICDSANCYHFSSDDNGHLYRAQTTLANFPNGMGNMVIALQDASPDNLFEASNVYNLGNGTILLIVECIGSTGHRYFRSWTSSTINGAWTALAATEANPFAGASNVQFPGGTWTADISHGEAIRTNVDQTMMLGPCGPTQYLYQGLPTGSNESYNDLPWKLALLTSTTCTSSGGGTTTTSTAPTTKPTTTPPSPTTTSSKSSGGGTGCTTAKYGQCGGEGFTGCQTCASGSTCTYSNPYYSQCL